MQRFVASPEEYLQLVPANQLPLVDHLRKLILQVAPRANEKISYGMLGFADDTGDLFAVAAQKNYVGLYVMPTEAVTMLAAELADVDHGKCCLRFKKLTDIPTSTIKKLLKLALELRTETSAPAEKKSAAKKKPPRAAKKKSS